jgi:hypothetical protein
MMHQSHAVMQYGATQQSWCNPSRQIPAKKATFSAQYCNQCHFSATKRLARDLLYVLYQIFCSPQCVDTKGVIMNAFFVVVVGLLVILAFK